MSNIYDMTDTWNNAGVVFAAIQMNVTDTASDPTSKLLDVQVGGVSQTNIQKNGLLNGKYAVFDNTAGGDSTNSTSLAYYRAGLSLGANGMISWGGAGSSSSDLTVRRDAAGILAQQNGANAQVFRAYNTWSSAANNEWFGLDWQTTANVARLRMVANGTGVARPIAVDAFQKAGAAVAGDIPTGTFAVVRDTSGLTTKLIYNNAGTLMTVALA